MPAKGEFGLMMRAGATRYIVHKKDTFNTCPIGVSGGFGICYQVNYNKNVNLLIGGILSYSAHKVNRTLFFESDVINNTSSILSYKIKLMTFEVPMHLLLGRKRAFEFGVNPSLVIVNNSKGVFYMAGGAPPIKGQGISCVSTFNVAAWVGYNFQIKNNTVCPYVEYVVLPEQGPLFGNTSRVTFGIALKRKR